ncbi:MAG TPA: hypothetical protein VEB22_03185 [Phycisphaerales bacterium]|nr:hypothetical protein [Phycisphaerales bacterium]
MSTFRASILLTALAAILCVLGGCAFQQHREQLAQLHASGRDNEALALLESPETRKLYGDQDRLLYLLDHGALMLQSGRPDQALAELEQAEQIMDYGGRRGPGDELTEWLINDTAAPYVGEPYESIYVNVFKLLAQLTRADAAGMGATGTGRQGVISGGATVEARRAAAKADFLRQRFTASQEKLNTEVRSRADDPRAADAAYDPSVRAAPATTAGRFIESPLGTYLTAVTFMKSGDAELQQVAGRRLADSIQQQGRLIGDVNPEAFASLGSLSPADANVLLVAFSGVGPTKVVQRVGPIPIFTYPLYFELPVLRSVRSPVASVRATLTPREPSESNPPQSVELNLVENLSRVAEENHRRQLPQIYQRTLIRASIRSAAAVVGTEALRRSSSRNSRHGVEIAGAIGGLLAMTAIERADTRCWVFLPGQAHVALAKLPAGTFDATIEYLDARGRVVDTRTTCNLSAADDPRALATALTFTTR